MRVRSLVCGAEVVLSFYNRVCGLDSRFYFSESSVNANGYRVSIVQKRREKLLPQGWTIIQRPEYELARNAINSTEPLAGSRLVA